MELFPHKSASQENPCAFALGFIEPAELYTLTENIETPRLTQEDNGQAWLTSTLPPPAAGITPDWTLRPWGASTGWDRVDLETDGDT
ncbi:hypothetical protein SKAU_G00035990 [Synaphobranchus kaupii]|uniref:Uncharacterized protein n=1 Tax=Synaphobranchus kaupii TaxID=118154 RepID=A0A9Q1GG48_SYNKA|nr:hypothetical protein SKAU_G00035990 [Synaphobranchus kaupii]